MELFHPTYSWCLGPHPVQVLFWITDHSRVGHENIKLCMKDGNFENKHSSTPLKINMLNPKNEGLEDDFPLQTDDFQVPC